MTNRNYTADRDLFRDLDASIAREREIAEQLDAYLAANGRYPSEREVSDICQAAALRHSRGNGCVAVLLAVVGVVGVIGGVL